MIKRKQFSRDERKQILEKTNYRCAHCGKKLDEISMTIEHIFPVSKGGDNSEFNVTALCETCNFEKSNFTYEVERYYKYILPEYEDSYSKHFLKMRCKIADYDSIMEMSQKIYEIHPIENFDFVYRVSKRNKKQGMEMFRKLSVKLKLEKGYDADAEKVVEFLNKCKQKYGTDIGVYTNEYIIRDHMRKGSVLILRNVSDEIYGVFIFIKIKYIDNLEDCMQLHNFSDVTGMFKNYVMTLAITNAKADECRSEIMTDFFINMISKKSMPIFFNILGYNEADTDYEYMNLPLKFCGLEGNIQFLSIKGMRKYLTDFFEPSIKKGLNSKEEIDEVVEATLNSDYVFKNGDYYKLGWEGLGGVSNKKEN